MSASRTYLCPACDGKRSPSVHAKHAIQGADALIRQQQARRAGGAL